MLRITELRLPLDHPGDALRAAIVARLRIADADLVGFTVFRRGYDARKKSAIVLSYTLDCELRDEAAVLAGLAGDRHIRPAPTRATDSSPMRQPSSVRPGAARS